MTEPNPSPLPRIRGTQIGLGNPAQIDQIKNDMLGGRFAWRELRAQVTGVVDPRGVYHVKIGHHRMAAVMEILRETGNDWYIRMLLECGAFQKVECKPHESRPLPGRDWWSWFRNLIGY
jgi:hypothetical protein